MGISVQPTPINPGVIQQQDNSGAQFLQALLGGANLAQQYQQMQLQKTQLERAERERELEKQNAAAEGEALRQIILGFGRAETDQVDNTIRSAVQMAGVTRGMPAPTASVGMQNAGPMGQLGAAVQNAPAQAVKGVAAASLPLMQIAERKRNEADRIANIERAIASVAPEKQKGARSVLTFAEMGANLPAAMQQQLWPELFPPEAAIDPQVMNSATGLFKAGTFSWGQVRRIYGLPRVEGIPDDVKYTPPTLKYERRPTANQEKVGASLSVMQQAAPILDAYSERRAPGLLQSAMQNTRRGGLAEMLANPFLTDEERQVLSSARNFSDAWMRVISGAQTNESEYPRILSSIIERIGDDPSTRQQKRNMRMQMMLAAQDIAAGAVSREGALDRMERMDWSPEQRKLLQEYRARMRKYEAKLKAGMAQMDPQGPVESPDELQDRLQMLEQMILQSRREP